ncbi:MAG: SPFH domain-containing protein, partial [Candidatus Yanofskybacteria bacterium]|nr:SPFH domain-containing protein [Candidatus Yanofskybacteria bacterium]
MRMKKFALAATLAVLTVIFSGCGWATPDAGHEAVLVKKPIIFGHGGVDPEPVKTGRQLIAVTTDSIVVNMQPQQFEVHFDDLMSSDGVPLDFDAVIRLKVVDSVSLIKNFGPAWYENNIKKEFANRVRQAVRKHGMNETAISTVAIDDIDREVSDAMVKNIETAKLPVELVQITVGKANPPDSIKTQRINTAAEQQRQLTEQQRKLAEDQRMAAENSRAKADNAYRESMQLSPSQFLQLEQIKMMHDV